MGRKPGEDLGFLLLVLHRELAGSIWVTQHLGHTASGSHSIWVTQCIEAAGEHDLVLRRDRARAGHSNPPRAGCGASTLRRGRSLPRLLDALNEPDLRCQIRLRASAQDWRVQGWRV